MSSNGTNLKLGQGFYILWSDIIHFLLLALFFVNLYMSALLFIIIKLWWMQYVGIFQLFLPFLLLFIYLFMQFLISGSAPKGIEEQEGEESEPAENDGQNELLMIEYQEEEIQYSGALPFTHSFRNCRFSNWVLIILSKFLLIFHSVMHI